MWPFRRSTASVQTFAVAGGQVRAIGDGDADVWATLFGLADGGIPAGASAALSYGPSAAAIRLLSTLCASTPLHAYRRQGDDSRERARNHAAELLLGSFANPWTPARDFITSMTRTVLLEGDAFAQVIRVRGEPRELHIVKATVEYDRVTAEPSYRVSRADGTQVILGWNDVLHLKSPTGKAPAKQAARAIELGLRLEKSANDLMRNGGRPSGLLTLKGHTQKNLTETVMTAWKAVAEQHDTAGTPYVLSGDVSYTALSQTSTDSQHIENRKLQAIETLAFFGVPPTMSGLLEDASLNNSEALGRQFLTYALKPWLDAWVDAATRVFIDPAARASTYLEHQPGELTQADTKAVAESLKAIVGGPLLTPNEGRARLNLPAVEGGEALYPPQGTAPAEAPAT